MGPRQIGGSGDPAITPPIPGQDPLGRLEGPFRKRNTRSPWVPPGPAPREPDLDQEGPRLAPHQAPSQGAEPPGPWASTHRAQADPATGPAQQAAAPTNGSPGLDCWRQRWPGRPIAAGDWGRELGQGASSLSCWLGRGGVGLAKGSPRGRIPARLGGQGRARWVATDQAKNPNRSSERPLGP